MANSFKSRAGGREGRWGGGGEGGTLVGRERGDEGVLKGSSSNGKRRTIVKKVIQYHVGSLWLVLVTNGLYMYICI